MTFMEMLVVNLVSSSDMSLDGQLK
jgi:hypothetical protein